MAAKTLNGICLKIHVKVTLIFMSHIEYHNDTIMAIYQLYISLILKNSFVELFINYFF